MDNKRSEKALNTDSNRYAQGVAGGRQGRRRNILNPYTTKDGETFACSDPFDCRRQV